MQHVKTIQTSNGEIEVDINDNGCFEAIIFNHEDGDHLYIEPHNFAELINWMKHISNGRYWESINSILTRGD